MDSNTVGIILLVLKETGLQLEKLIRDAQNEALDKAQRQHALNIAAAKVMTMRKNVDDAICVIDSINNDTIERSCE